MGNNVILGGNKRCNKGKDKKTQIVRFKNYLIENTATCTMVSDATGIPQKNLCRLKRSLEKRGKLCEVFKGKCCITGHKAAYLTTNPETLKKYGIQLNLFDNSATGGATL